MSWVFRRHHARDLVGGAGVRHRRLVGLIFMAILRVRQPAFFRGETIIHESAHAMRPHEHLVS
jgi:hypothetical protein